MRWQVHGRRALYASEWVGLELADVELPDGHRFEHHVVRAPRQVAVAAVTEADRVLMLWRHRFITDRWGWELPAGLVEHGEDPADAARREAEEETGWRPDRVRLLRSYAAMPGLSDARFHLYQADGAVLTGPPSDPHEAAEIAWVPLDRAWEHVTGGTVDDAATLLTLALLRGR